MAEFFKYHGLGNDFIIIDNIKNNVKLDRALIRKLCDRNFGIGADGIILVEESSIADVRMVIYNSDGSNPDMCGNGVRCFSKYVYDRGIVRKSPLKVETGAGLMDIELTLEGDSVSTVRVNMGVPSFEPHRIPSSIERDSIKDYPISIGGESFRITSMLMGVPHTVVFTQYIDDEYVLRYGPLIEKSNPFPQGTNVNFVKVLSRDEVILRTWERGVGYTLACGTGACSGAVAGILNGILDDIVSVQLRGGALRIHWRDGQEVYMEGPAEEVFSGNYKDI